MAAAYYGATAPGLTARRSVATVGVTRSARMQEPTERELSLMYFNRYQRCILDLLEITRDPATFDDEEKLKVVDAYLDIVTS
ncbi:MAG: hypothetical protein VKI42_06405 [Synechococcaceae cyanobacterium]|nr:hypothetical protein [Synechococcaceae cyanobacterium]